MRQHVISRWLLAAFARHEHGRRVLTAFDKTTGAFVDHDADDFLAETDAHSTEIEHQIEQLETPASAASMRLRKRLTDLPPGLYAVSRGRSDVAMVGAALRDVGLYEGMRLQVSQHEIPAPNDDDRLALSRYVGLMYQRAPKNEAAIQRWGETYDRAAQQALDAVMPGLRTGLETSIARRRSRIPRMAEQIGQRLFVSSWFVVKAASDAPFVLGDCPVAATTALGHDDDWHAILSDITFAVVMPVGPTVALVMAPQQVIPTADVDADGASAAINRLMWRSADRYVLASSRQNLEIGYPATDEDRRHSVQPPHDEARIAASAQADTRRIVLDVTHRYNLARWFAENPSPRWDGCRLDFGAVRAGPPEG